MDCCARCTIGFWANAIGTIANTHQTFDGTDSVLGFVATCGSGKNDCR
jgi:hypothetical protein